MDNHDVTFPHNATEFVVTNVDVFGTSSSYWMVSQMDYIAFYPVHNHLLRLHPRPDEGEYLPCE